MNHQKKLQLVISVIKEYPEAANDDVLLIQKVWEREGLYIPYDQLRKVTHSETITRRRRQAFNLGLIEYSPKAMKSREQAFKNERDNASPIPPPFKYELVTDLEVKRYDQASLL